MTDITKIRTNAYGQPYLTEPTSPGFVHIAYHDFNANDLDGTQKSLYATEERHMVNGINSLYGTSFNWGDLEGKTVEFFNQNSQTNPFTKLEFTQLGEYYIAKIIRDDTMDIDSVKSITEIGEMLSGDIPTKDKVYYATKEHQKDLVRFIRNNFSTHQLLTSPSRDIDFTQMLLGDNNHLTTVILRNFTGQNGVSTLTFKNEITEVTGIAVNEYTKSAIITAFNSLNAGTPVTTDNFVSYNKIRVFDPIAGVDTVTEVYKVTRGDDTKYVMTASEESDGGFIIPGI